MIVLWYFGLMFYAFGIEKHLFYSNLPFCCTFATVKLSFIS